MRKKQSSTITLAKVLFVLLVVQGIFFNSAFAKVHKKSSYSKNDLFKLVTKEEPKSASLYSSSNLTTRFASWGINPNYKQSSINLKDAWKSFKKKKNVVVAVIDTGIDPSHPFLSKNVHVSKGSVHNGNFGLDFSKNRSHHARPSDDHGHGTHVAGIIKSVFPEVKILTLKYYNPSASGQDNLNSTIEALKYAVNLGVDIINYSGGGPEPSLEELRILKRAEAKGILVVAAAGNEESNIDNKDNAYYPASYGLKNIITVAAHDQNVKLLSASNYGKDSVDISAPGYRIKSSLPGHRAGYLTGTSQATAFVSGVAALIKAQYPNLSNLRIKNIIKGSAKKVMSLANKCSTGGILDAAQALKSAGDTARGKDAARSIANKKRQGKIHYRLNN